MRAVMIAALVAGHLATFPASSQGLMVAPRTSRPDLQDDISRMLAQRQREVDRQQQQSFDSMQGRAETDRKNSLPVLPSHPGYRGSLLGQ